MMVDIYDDLSVFMTLLFLNVSVNLLHTSNKLHADKTCYSYKQLCL